MSDPSLLAEQLVEDVVDRELVVTAGRPHVLPVYDMAEVVRRVKAAGRRKFRVHGLIVDGSYGVTGARFKAGKTFDCLDLTVSVATGTSWLERFPTEEGEVTCYLGEGPRPASCAGWMRLFGPEVVTYPTWPDECAWPSAFPACCAPPMWMTWHGSSRSTRGGW